jgi:xylulokinase
MQKKYLIGVDLGTSGTKAALFDTQGNLICESSAEVPIYYPKPGVVEQENDDFYNTAAQTVGDCLRQSGVEPRAVAAIAFDSQMAGIGSIDEDYQPATRFDSWLDMRCEPYINRLKAEHSELITRLTGCAPTCDHGPKILWWQHERPEAYSRIVKFVTPAGYVAGKMAGLRADQAFMDYTFIHFSGLSDARAGTWSQEICTTLGVDMDRLPQIVEPWRVVGEVSSEAARLFELAPGTPIAAGCGDTAAGALGAGIVRPGMIFDSAGTASVLAGCTDTFVADVEHQALLTMRSVIPGLWHPLAYIAGGGQTLAWYRDKFLAARSGEPQSGTAAHYALLDKLVEQVPPGAEGLFFSPHLSGRICPATPEMRGAWIGFSFGHSQAHFYRAILESIAAEYAYYLSILKESIPNLELTEARVIGGGARSRVWNQIKADVLGVPFQRMQLTEFGAWGSAMIAGKAAGIFEDLAQVALEHARLVGEPVYPDPERHAFYQDHVARHIAWQAALANEFGVPAGQV